jgi:hypothetical protein
MRFVRSMRSMRGGFISRKASTRLKSIYHVEPERGYSAFYQANAHL